MQPIKIALSALLCVVMVACLSPEPTSDDPSEREVIVEIVDDPDAVDTVTDGTSEICCLEGWMTCPTTGETWDYVCAGRAAAAGRCNAACPVACKRYEYNVC